MHAGRSTLLKGYRVPTRTLDERQIPYAPQQRSIAPLPLDPVQILVNIDDENIKDFEFGSTMSKLTKHQTSDLMATPSKAPWRKDAEPKTLKPSASIIKSDPSNINKEAALKDSNAVTTSSTPFPFTPRRLAPGLQLQVPVRLQPLSPILDPALGYSVGRRPRHDFARACTSLHHSTLAESSDSSPMTPNGFPTPRKGLDSPIAMHHGGGNANLFSDNGVETDEDSDSSCDVDLEDLNMDSAPSTQRRTATSGDAGNSASWLNIRHAARLTGASRQSSSSASSTSLASPSPTPPMSSDSKTGGKDEYFGKPLKDVIAKRRDSLSLAMKEVVFEANREERKNGKTSEKEKSEESNAIKRPVTRRGNLLPKTKHFQRVRAALMEESAPADAEVKSEATVTRQLREDDEDDMAITPMTPLPERRHPMDIPLPQGPTTDSTMSFQSQAQKNGGFWEAIASSSPPSWPRMNSDGDVMMGTESLNNSFMNVAPSPEVKKLKRRRADEETRFEEPEIFKRRAVSPGLCQSPTLMASSSPISAGSSGAKGTTGTAAKRLSFIQDTHEGLLKMSLGSSFGS